MKFKEYYNKVLGCFIGKNIGGTLGAPFECYRGEYDIDWFQQDISSPIPNDDVDLQLVWLRAVETEGRKLDNHTLAEYWNTYISSTVSEYGTGKNNFNMGILPPICGRLRNRNKDSNGAWIRSEIWACLCAGSPELAAEYAFYDATVDHADEGVYAAVFVATLQASAFFEADLAKLIEIGLSYLPKECAVERAVRLAIDCHSRGLSFSVTRKEMFKAVPTNFGLMGGYWKGTAEVPANSRCPVQQPDPEIPLGENGFDAPWHIGMVIASLLYGEGDFAKTICLAVNCGEDTDCTAGTAGSILGILLGADRLPERWVGACSNRIAVCSLRYDQYLCPPGTVSELAYRVALQAPQMLGSGRCNILPGFDFKNPADGPDNCFEITPVDDFRCGENLIDYVRQESAAQLISEHKNTVRKHFDLYTITVSYDESLVKIEEGVEKTLELRFLNRLFTSQYLTVRILEVPQDWQVSGGREFCVGLEQWHGSVNSNNYVLKFTPLNFDRATYTVVLEIASNGRGTRNYLPLTFVNGSCMQLNQNR